MSSFQGQSTAASSPAQARAGGAGPAATGERPAAVSIRGVSKTFGSTAAVRELDLDVPAGSLCGFLGPNGAGKSTTIRMIMSIIYPDEGTIDVLGGSALESKDRIGYLPEERGLYRTMKVGEYLRYIGRLKGCARSGLDDRVKGWLARLEIAHCHGKKCQELSKGMQQKVQFLAALVHDPELIILDEPYSGLDPVNAELIHDLISELRADGRTILFSTHVLHQAEQVCDRIFLIHRGHKRLDASLDEIRERFDPRTILIVPQDEGPWRGPAIEGVRDVRPAAGGTGSELQLDEDADAHAVMTAALVHGPVRSIEIRRPSLEEVFVQVVREEDGALAAEEAEEELHVQGA